MFESNTIVGDAGKVLNFIVTRAAAITESDTDTFAPGLLFVGVGGNVKAKPMGNSDFITFKNVQDGSFLPVYIIAVHTDTTATDMVICY